MLHRSTDAGKSMTHDNLPLKGQEQVLAVHYLRAFKGGRAELKQKPATESNTRNRANETQTLGKERGVVAETHLHTHTLLPGRSS